MTGPARPRSRLAGALAMCAAVAACADPAAPASAPPGPAPAAPATGSTGPSAPDPAPPATTAEMDPEERVRVAGAAAKASVAKRNAEIDRSARDAIERFRGLTYDPSEDAHLVRASGRIRVDVDGCRGEYSFRFDASLPEKERLVTETVSEETGIHEGSARQALRFAHFAVHGPYAAVMSYLPPVEWQIVRADDGRMLVVMPPWRGGVGVSYRLDDRGIVAMSGTSDGKQQSRTVFTWRTHGARPDEQVILEKQVEDEGKASIEYVYGDRDGVPVLVRATLVEGEHRYAALVDWDEFVRSPADR